MKRLVLSLVALATISSVANASLKYECSRYVNSSYQGYTTVVANNKSEAEQKAYVKFKEQLGKRVDYVKCK
ncbi:hypothetical protein [Sulfurimonas sp.]